MNLNFKISKINNLFFFVLESARKSKKIKSLTTKEKKTLKDFIKIISIQTDSMPVNLTFIIYDESKKWKELEKQINIKNTSRLKEILNVFNKQFEKTWPNKQKILKEIIRYFDKNKNIFLKIISTINKLCGLKKSDLNNIPIHLIFNSETNNISGQSSWTPKKQNIILECSNKSVKKINKFDLCVLAHEIFHLLAKENKKLENLIKTSAKKYSKIIKKVDCHVLNEKYILEELILSSFIPEGYLAKKYFNLPIKKSKKTLKKTNNLIDFSYTRKQIAYLMKDISTEYVKKKKEIDKNYIKELIKIIKLNLKKD